MLCIADAIHNCKWVEIILTDQNRGRTFLNVSLVKGYVKVPMKRLKNDYSRDW